MTPAFSNNYLTATIAGNATGIFQVSHNPHWVPYLSGVRVHGDSEGATIYFSAIDVILNTCAVGRSFAAVAMRMRVAMVTRVRDPKGAYNFCFVYSHYGF